MLGIAWIGAELRQAARRLRRAPGFALVVGLTLAVGIGANTAIFAVVDTLLLRELPYPNAPRLIAIQALERDHPERPSWLSAPALADLRADTQSFAGVAGISPVWDNVVESPGGAERLQGLYVSANFLPLLGVAPAAGRDFTAAEDRPGAPGHSAILSGAYARRRFGSAAAALGQTLALDDGPYTVVGVLPSSFHYLGPPLDGTDSAIDLWLPLAANELAQHPRTARWLKVVGLLRPGVTAAQAAREVHGVGETLARAYPASDAGLRYNAEPLAERVTGNRRPEMLLLWAAAGLVLLLVCLNVAHVAIVRAWGRQRELAVRGALGASPLRLLAATGSEAALLAVAGGFGGLALARAALAALTALAPPALLNGYALVLDARAILFAAAATLLCALLTGLPPAAAILRAWRAQRWNEPSLGAGGARHRLRDGLAVGQLALALALLAGAGLLVRTFQRVLEVHPGFDADHAITVSTQLDLPPSATDAQEVASDHRLLDHLGQLPGLSAVGAINRLPLEGENITDTLWIESRTFSPADQPSLDYRVASPGYFAAMGLPLLAGRLYQPSDNRARVAVISQAAARLGWPGQSALGRHIKTGPRPETQAWITIVGIVGDVHHAGLDQPAAPAVYLPLDASGLGAPVLVARAEGNPAAALAELAAAVRDYDPHMPVYRAFTLHALVEQSLAGRRFLMLLLSAFSLTALVLAMLGLYGTVAQSVLLRRRELGIRLALGATPAGLLGNVLRRSLALAALGIALGCGAAALGSDLLRPLLFGVTARDPAVFAAVAALLAAAATLAALGPALRAAHTDPQAVLRQE